MKIGVISSRANSANISRNGICEDQDYVFQSLDKALKALSLGSDDDVVIVSGGGRGPETFAKDYSESNGFNYTVVTPRTKARGAMAFPERNTSITSLCDAMVVFWGGEDMYVSIALGEAMFMKKPVFLFPI